MKEVYVLTQYYIYDNDIEGIFGNIDAIKRFISKHYNSYFDGNDTYYYKDAEILPNSHVNVYYEGLDYPVDDLLYAEKYQVIE